MSSKQQQAVLDFYRYPPVGADDWRYAFATARVRVLESMMLTKGTLVDMANAETFAAAAELLSGSDYADGANATTFSAVEKILIEKRSEVRSLYSDLIVDKGFIEPLEAREDFANMRLAVRRVVTGKPIGLDYSDEGSVPASEFEEIFEQENYDRFPDYLQEAVQEAVLGYYQHKDIRAIDYGIDRAHGRYKIAKAEELDSVFLRSLFQTQIDLANIRTMLRLKMADRDERTLFLSGGFVELHRFIQGLSAGYDTLAGLFFATPYFDVVEDGVSYLMREQSFLALERLCDEHLMGFLKTALMVTAGPQPVVAYLLLKEGEIRTVRMILSAKFNGMQSTIIMDRLAEV